jgi:hypothetical protein
MRLLFPSLPPEVRNTIYTYASQSTQGPATTSGLPFPPKTYDLKHTNVSLCALHHGNLSLLALQKYKYLEGAEYHSWLLSHGLHIRLGIVFTGHVDSFVQKHWDEKMSASLRKLVKKYAWLAHVPRWEIRIVWDANVDSMRKHPGKAAEIVNGMVRTVLGFQSEMVKKRRGDVRVRFHVPYPFVAAKSVYGLQFGLREFFDAAGTSGARRELREVTTGPLAERGDGKIVGQLHAVPMAAPEKSAFAIRGHQVEWSEDSEGELVMKKVVDGQKSWIETLRINEKGVDASGNWQSASLRCECGDLRDANIVDFNVPSLKPAISS